MAEWGQLRRGLNVLGVGEEMDRNPDMLLGFFTSACAKPLTAGLRQCLQVYIATINFNVADYIHELFDPVAFSDGRERDAEALAYINFTRILNEEEGMFICHHEWQLTIAINIQRQATQKKR